MFYFAFLEVGSVPYRKPSPGSVLPIDELACFWVRQKLQTLTVKGVSMSAFMNNECKGVKILQTPHSFFPIYFVQMKEADVVYCLPLNPTPKSLNKRTFSPLH